MYASIPFRRLATLAAVACLAACSSPVKLAEKPLVATPVQAAPTDTRAVAAVVAPSVDPLNDPNSVLAKRSIYFDFDKYAVKSEFAPVISAHAQYLSKASGKKILIQGNTDERGGSEYNLALGQKRAEAVRKAMALSGTPEAQMEAVSLGKEKPKASGNDEAAWSENRRADIVYSQK